MAAPVRPSDRGAAADRARARKGGRHAERWASRAPRSRARLSRTRVSVACRPCRAAIVRGSPADLAPYRGPGQKEVDLGCELVDAGNRRPPRLRREGRNEVVLAVHQHEAARGKGEDRLVAEAVDEGRAGHVDGDRMSRKGARQSRPEREVAAGRRRLAGQSGIEIAVDRRRLADATEDGRAQRGLGLIDDRAMGEGPEGVPIGIERGAAAAWRSGGPRPRLSGACKISAPMCCASAHGPAPARGAARGANGRRRPRRRAAPARPRRA